MLNSGWTGRSVKWLLLPMLLLAAIIGWSISGTGAAPVPLSDSQKIKLITQLSARLLAHNHYRQQQIDEEISSKTFDALFKRLDPNKMYFSAADMAKFEPQRKELGGKLLNGDVAFVYEVYEAYRKRFEEYRVFAEKTLADGFDFTVDETFVLDRRNEPYFASQMEMQEFWRKKLKNDVLNFRLMRRVMEEDAKTDVAATADAESGKAGEEAERKAIRALWDTKKPEEKIQRRLRDIANELAQQDQYDIAAMLLTSLASAYGPHSDYSSEKEDANFDISMSLALTGIGATLTSEDGYTRIVELVPGGPAALDGRLQPEDRIIAVAQESQEPVDVIDMALDNVVKMIRGPEGTKVSLTYLPGRQGRNAVPESLTLTRAKVELKESEVKGEIKDVTTPEGESKRVGVIRFDRFYVDFEAISRGDMNFKSCSKDMQKVLEDFKKAGVDSVVIDLRFNGGGGLTEAIAMSGLFVHEGPIVQVRSRNRKVSVELDPDKSIAYDGALVIMTSKLTASAAEIFTNAIRDYQRGIVVGDTRTFGKGTVIDVVKLEQLLRQVNQGFPAGSLRYETAEFYGVNGESNQQLGIVPDIVLPSLTEEMEIGELFSDNHLPWDQIEGVEHRVYDENIDQHRKLLKEQSELRRSQSKVFTQLQRSIDLFRTYRDRDQVSLNENTRYSEYLEERKIRDEEEKLLREGAGAPAESTEKIDPQLDEAIQIAVDYSELLKLSQKNNG